MRERERERLVLAVFHIQSPQLVVLQKGNVEGGFFVCLFFFSRHLDERVAERALLSARRRDVSEKMSVMSMMESVKTRERSERRRYRRSSLLLVAVESSNFCHFFILLFLTTKTCESTSVSLCSPFGVRASSG